MSETKPENQEELEPQQSAGQEPETETQHEQNENEAAAEQPTDEIEVLRKELEEARAESVEAHERSLRMLAELDNTKKRLEREKDHYVKFAAERMIRDLLPILDSFQQAVGKAVEHAESRNEAEAVTKGMRLIYDQLLRLIEKEGVTRMETLGKPFDPNQHEAVLQVPVEEGQEPDHVVEELQVGYTMHGKVIRPAMVKISTQ